MRGSFSRATICRSGPHSLPCDGNVGHPVVNGLRQARPQRFSSVAAALYAGIAMPTNGAGGMPSVEALFGVRKGGAILKVINAFQIDNIDRSPILRQSRSDHLLQRCDHALQIVAKTPSAISARERSPIRTTPTFVGQHSGKAITNASISPAGKT